MDEWTQICEHIKEWPPLERNRLHLEITIAFSAVQRGALMLGYELSVENARKDVLNFLIEDAVPEQAKGNTMEEDAFAYLPALTYLYAAGKTERESWWENAIGSVIAGVLTHIDLRSIDLIAVNALRFARENYVHFR